MRIACLTILIVPLVMLGCGEESMVERYETTLPAGFDWPATELREASHKADDMTWVWEVPAGWMDAPEVPDQLVADYRFKGSNESLPGRMTVSKIDGDAGGVNANVLRWLQQIYLTTPRGLGPKDKMTPMPIGIGTVTFVELHGQYQGEHMPTRISAAIVQIPADDGSVYQTWFFKMAGDDATVDSEAVRMGLAQMVLTFRPKGTPRPPLPGLDEIKTGEADAEVDAEEPVE